MKPSSLLLVVAIASCANSEQQEIAHSGRVWPMDVTGGSAECAEAPGQCGKYSNIPGCHVQYLNDVARCNKVKIVQCWSSASERLAYCNKTKGQVGWPPLITKVPR